MIHIPHKVNLAINSFFAAIITSAVIILLESSRLGVQFNIFV